LRNEKKNGAKIREARLDLVPHLAVVGAKELESNTLALRSRKDGELGTIEVEKVIEKLLEEIKIRQL
jgi:threonyl-tRNA synthetase